MIRLFYSLSISILLTLILNTDCSWYDDDPLRLTRRRDLDIKSQPFMERDDEEIMYKDSVSSYRLPKSLVPYHYNISIVPILDTKTGLGEQFTAPGNVKIFVECIEETSLITLHAFLLKIYTVKVNVRNGGEVVVKDHYYDKVQRDFYRISLASPLTPGKKYEINIEFLAPVSGDRADGLYRSSYRDPATGEKRYLASTQFESYYARQAFPCFDEPALKARFDMNIGRSENYTALSNAELASSSPMQDFNGWVWDKFSTTVIMSTYLVAFVVSEYTYAEADKSLFHGKPVRVYGPDFVIEKGAGNHSAEAAAKLLTFYENYFDIEYPMGKMDSVMDPGFQHGAMENWGLNIYRDRYLAVVPGLTSESQKASVTSIVAHELGHQWFGNLVTCSFWHNIWLNEGFATYYSYIALQHVYPEFEAEKGLLTDALQTAFRIDSRDATYSILLDTDSPRELERRVGGIPYMKGSSLVRMMDGFLRSDVFHTAIKKYLRKWSYKAVAQDDLFDVLTEVAHEHGTLSPDLTVNEIMSGWTKQKGFPVVKVNSLGNNTVYLIQDPFRNEYQTENKYYSWYVPISMATEDNPDFKNHVPKFWLKKGVALKTFKHDTSKWIVINPEATGYYRVLYDEHLTSLIQNQLNKDYSVISSYSRSQILDDYLSFAFKKDIPYGTSLEFTKYMHDETDDMAWDVLLGYLGRIYYFYDGSLNFEGFKRYLLPKIENVLTTIGYEQHADEKGNSVVFRSRLLTWACAFKLPSCLNFATNTINQWRDSSEVNSTVLPVDQQNYIFCAAVAGGGKEMADFIVKRIEVEQNLRQRHHLVSSLGCVHEPMLIQALLDSLIVDDKPARSNEDVLLIFKSLAMNPFARQLTLRFIKKHVNKIIEIYDSQKHIDYFLYTLTDHLYTEQDLSEMQDFVETETVLDDQRLSYEQYISEVKSNIAWMKRHYAPMKEWFDAQVQTESL